MKKLLIAAAVAFPMSAHAASTVHHARTQMGSSQPQIACTEVGCLPVPRDCYPTGGKTLGGLPTGFDVMVCPGGPRYGHL